MKRTRRLLLSVLTVSLWTTGAVGAQAEDSGSFSYSPKRGPAGSEIAIEGTCLRAGSANGVTMEVGLFMPGPAKTRSYSQDFPVAADGSVRGALHIPNNMPSGDYTIAGGCRAGGGIFFSDTGSFSVTDATRRGAPQQSERSDANVADGEDVTPSTLADGSPAPTVADTAQSPARDRSARTSVAFGVVFALVVAALFALLLRRNRRRA